MPVLCCCAAVLCCVPCERLFFGVGCVINSVIRGDFEFRVKLLPISTFVPVGSDKMERYLVRFLAPPGLDALFPPFAARAHSRNSVQFYSIQFFFLQRSVAAAPSPSFGLLQASEQALSACKCP
jgi:hypothetical protein